MDSLQVATRIVANSLQLSREELKADTELVGNFPEFNSLTIVAIITAIEDELDCVIDDSEISTDIFATVGDLAAFIASRAD